jgi:hypothetical protein
MPLDNASEAVLDRAFHIRPACGRGAGAIAKGFGEEAASAGKELGVGLKEDFERAIDPDDPCGVVNRVKGNGLKCLRDETRALSEGLKRSATETAANLGSGDPERFGRGLFGIVGLFGTKGVGATREVSLAAKADHPGEFGPFHRLESPTQTPAVARQQAVSGEIWGRAPRYSDRPQVQAYGGPLPEGARGIEFHTAIAPDPGGVPWLPTWSGPRPGVRIEGDFAKISCWITRNTQC